MNYGDGLYGGMFFGGMYSAAFFETDPRRVVETGLACIPAQSGYGKVIRDVLDWSAKYPDDWRKTWQALEEKWDKDDPCPDGALAPFNIDARLNGAYVALGVLYGNRDFAKTMEVSTRSGQDSDCNPVERRGHPRGHARLQGDPRHLQVGHPRRWQTRNSSSRTTHSTRSASRRSTAPSK